MWIESLESLNQENHTHQWHRGKSAFMSDFDCFPQAFSNSWVIHWNPLHKAMGASSDCLGCTKGPMIHTFYEWQVHWRNLLVSMHLPCLCSQLHLCNSLSMYPHQGQLNSSNTMPNLHLCYFFPQRINLGNLFFSFICFSLASSAPVSAKNTIEGFFCPDQISKLLLST